MSTATIYFSNGETLTLHEGDLITPIVKSEHDNQVFASMAAPVEMENHTQNGLIPSFLSAMCLCDFFFVLPNQDIAYAKNSIVKIDAT